MNAGNESKVDAACQRASSISPLWLLVRVNARQGWRRLLSIREQSRLLTTLIGGFMVGYFGLSFWLFYRGLKFAGSFPGFGMLLVERMIYLLFAFLFVLLLFSNLVIGYTNFFRNRETTFLLSLPLPLATIFQWKFIEAVVLASWAFLFLVAPLLAAFGLNYGVPWHFYPGAILLISLYLVLPGAAGAFGAICLARFLERRVFQLLTVGGALVALTALFFWLKPDIFPESNTEIRTLALLDKLMARTDFSQRAFLPSYWLSTGVLNWAEGAMASAGFFGLVLLSHSLFWGLLAFTRLGNLFYDAASAVQSRSGIFSEWHKAQAREAAPNEPLGRTSVLEAILGWRELLPRDARAIVLKDIRTFWRDTTQWGQTFVLFGLLGVYIINLRHFSNQLIHPFWVHLVSYLNLGACALNLATLTTRFVYPQFSLEGKRLWIIGMAPLGLVRVVLIKFWLAFISSLALTLGLIGLSCHMLHMPWDRFLFFVIAIVVMTFTLNGMATGLGALYPNFKEDNPGKIVSGFGGTFCLVLSFVYIAASVALLAVGMPFGRSPLLPPALQIGALGGFAILSWAVGWVPMRLALRRLPAYEI